MYILGINTSESITAVALSKNKQILASFSIKQMKKTASMLIPYIDFILKENDLTIKNIDLLSICSGPGSYTSLRIGYGTVKTLAIINNIPMVEVSRFRLMAETFMKYQHKLFIEKKPVIYSFLPTTYKKLAIESYIYNYYEKLEDRDIVLKEKAKIIDIDEFIDMYEKQIQEQDNEEIILLGEIINHRKANDFQTITENRNYFEYSPLGDSASYIANIGYDLYNNKIISNPYEAEPQYIHSPF